MLQFGFAVVIGVALLANAGGVVRLVYPLGALLVAHHLVTHRTDSYVSFSIWLWVLSPFVRRIADLQAGWQEQSLILLTPYLVVMLGAAVAVARAAIQPMRSLTLPRSSVMFLLAAVACLAGVPLGLVTGVPGATIETLNWMAPVVFGAYLASCVGELEEIETAVASTFAHAGTVMGLYGMYQFFRLPVWDESWMNNSGMNSIGVAEALSVRVFSTLHSPGVLAFFVLPPMVFWLARPSGKGLLPLCLSAVALLLSQVRTAWAGFAVSAILLVLTMKLGSALRMTLLVAFGGLCVAPFLQLPDVSERVNARIETIRDMPNYDSSATARSQAHEIALGYVLRHPLGAGIGAMPAELSFLGVRDSTLIAGLVQFGVIGMAVYALSVAMMTRRLWFYFRTANRPLSRGAAATALGMLATMPLGVPLAAQAGMLVWMFVGMAALHQPDPAPAALGSRNVASPQSSVGIVDRFNLSSRKEAQ